jgi:monovalent cation:H+ antiporter-2, CPA2 family
MDIPLLPEMITVFGLAILVILVCHRFKIPAIVGFLITGVMVGPHGLGFINAVDDVDFLATIGIVLLLFCVGMEFSLKKIFEYKRYFLIGGAIQVCLTVLGGCIAGLVFGMPFGECVFIGFLLSLSSTAITLRVLDEKSESDSPHGRLAVGILIFQDIVAIPMMLLTPFLSQAQANLDSNMVTTAAIGIGILIVAIVAAIKIVPALLYQITKTRSRELFLLTVLTICFAVAWLTSSLGLSLSLGAFLAGLIISESEYRHEAISDILPFQDVFTSFFFVSIGMLLDISFVVAQPFLIIILAALVLVLKTGTAGIAALVLGLPLRTAILSGLALSQIGEFSFVLAKNSTEYGLMDSYGYQLFLAVSLLTMGLTPTLITSSHQIANLLLKLPLPFKLKAGFRPQEYQQKVHLKDHMIIIGYGLSGKNLALAAKGASIPYYILEMNPQTVKIEREKGEPIHFGDATHAAVLNHADVDGALAAAVVINDHVAAGNIVSLLRQISPKLYIIVRTRYFEQIHALYDVGANVVIPDELGSSIEIFTRVLNLYQVPGNHIEQVVQQVRTASYEKLNDFYKNKSSLYDLKFGLLNLEVESICINSNSVFLERSLEELQLRAKYGINVVAIRRDNATITTVEPKMQIKVNDILTVTGEAENLKKLSELIYRTSMSSK